MSSNVLVAKREGIRRRKMRKRLFLTAVVFVLIVLVFLLVRQIL